MATNAGLEPCPVFFFFFLPMRRSSRWPFEQLGGRLFCHAVAPFGVCFVCVISGLSPQWSSEVLQEALQMICWSHFRRLCLSIALSLLLLRFWLARLQNAAVAWLVLK